MSDSTRLDDKVIAVTGAGHDIDREIALLCTRQGTAVVVNDLGASTEGDGTDTGPAADMVSQIHAEGGQTVMNSASVADHRGSSPRSTTFPNARQTMCWQSPRSTMERRSIPAKPSKPRSGPMARAKLPSAVAS